MSVVFIDIVDNNNMLMTDDVKSNIESLTNELICAISMIYHRDQKLDLVYTTELISHARVIEKKFMNKIFDIEHNCKSQNSEYIYGIYERLYHIQERYNLKLFITITDKDMNKISGFLLSSIIDAPMTKKGKPSKNGKFTTLIKGFFW